MRILVLSSLYPNSKIYMSGIFVHEQVKQIKNLGHSITVFAPVPYTFGLLRFFSKKYKAFADMPCHEIIDGVDIYHSKYLALPRGYLKAYWGYSYFKSMVSKIEKLHRENPFDLIHAHGSAPDDFGACLLSKKIGVPYVLTIHGDSVYHLVNKGGRFKNSKKSIQNAEAVIGVSSKVLDRVKKYTGRQDSLYKVLNGFIPGETKSAGADKNKINILFAATIIERKGCRFLIEAFKVLTDKYKNINLTIAGGGILLDEMKQLALRLNISDYVEFTGVVAHEDMMKYMAACDIFIMPSWDEAFGVVYLEAMSQKKPVVGTEGEGITDLVIDGENGFLVKPKDVKSIVEKLSLLVKDGNLRKEIGEKGYESACELTWENNAKKMIKIYQDVLKHSTDGG